MPRTEEGRWRNGKWETTSVGPEIAYTPPSKVSTADLGAAARENAAKKEKEAQLKALRGMKGPSPKASPSPASK